MGKIQKGEFVGSSAVQHDDKGLIKTKALAKQFTKLPGLSGQGVESS